MVTLAATGGATAAVMLLGVDPGRLDGPGPPGRSSPPTPVGRRGRPCPLSSTSFRSSLCSGPAGSPAIAAAVLYAAPAAVKIVADGVRAVPVETLEAAVASGSTTWQVITKVQLPMARPALALALNQGLMYVLSMVVVGGLVGAGALGYDVVAGFSQGEMFGKGLAAGLAIVVWGSC